MVQKLEDGRGVDDRECALGNDGAGNAYVLRVNSSGQLTITRLTGEALGADIDHLAAIGVVQAYDITATGAVVGITAGSVIVAIETIVTGTNSTLTLHDNASAASGTVIMPTVVTSTVNVLGYQRNIAGGQGALLVNGLYATVGGTGSPTFRVWAAPAAGA